MDTLQLQPGDLVRLDENQTAGVDCSRIYMIVATTPRFVPALGSIIAYMVLGFGIGNIYWVQRHQMLRVYI